MQLLSRDYDIKDICELMGVSRSGYYKWKNREKSERDIKREELIALVDLVHADHKTHGYRWTAAFIRLEYGYECSDNYVYKCFRFLGIKSETKHQVHYRKRKEKDKYPNLIFTTQTGHSIRYDGFQVLVFLLRSNILFRCVHEGDTDL